MRTHEIGILTKAETNTNLLSAEDLAVLDSTVFPLGARPDLVRECPDGRILLSEKGRQFYAAAFQRAGIAVNLEVIWTRKELHEAVMTASAALCAEADAGMRRELDAGRIPIQRREVVRTYLDGSVQEFIAAAERLERCSAAGKNVIPVGFGRSAAKIRSA